MPDDTKYGNLIPPEQNRGERGPKMECSEFEALLSEALDEGGLSPSVAGKEWETFEAHRRACGNCGLMFAEAQAGREWLRSLEMVEPPAYLVHNILAATSGVLSTRPVIVAGDGRTTPFGERLRERWDAWFAPMAAFVRQPRFAMSFGMIFFSFSLALNVAGVKASDVAKIDLRPAAVRHAYNDAEIRVVKYYDNIRFVYEIESKLRELKRANEPAEPAPSGQKDKSKNNNTSGQPDQREDRNYSQEYDQPVLAALRIGGPSTLFNPYVVRDGVEDISPDAAPTRNRRFV
jgi:hypothetical protein